MPLTGFGSNPGALRAAVHLPDDLADGAALVVVLHGCTQNAAGYDHGSGWSELADRYGFALLFPEQSRSNNPNLCFNWYSPADARRGRGEALSIRQMIETMIEAHGIDPRRVFVTGLSAGGAMTAVMLATYPELFAGGAIIAGLPFATADSVSEALERMRSHPPADDEQLGKFVRSASKHRGPWPTLSVWHGGRDLIVDPSNADAVVGQWRSLHGVDPAPTESSRVDGSLRECWRDTSGKIVIEKTVIPGMGHGTPLDTRGSDAVGTAGPHMLEAGISSTRHIAEFWGLTDGAFERRTAPLSDAVSAVPLVKAQVRPRSIPRLSASMKPAASGVGAVIEKALRQAGLMR